MIAGHTDRQKRVLDEQMHTHRADTAAYPVLPPFKGNVLDFHLRLLIDGQARRDAISAADISWTSTHFDTFNQLANNSEAFRLALEAATDWRYARQPRLAIGRIWGGIEAVFGITSELTYRVSLVAASLLEPRGEGRKDKFKAVRKLYGLRSKAVHGEFLPQEELTQAMVDSYQLLRALLLVTIERGHVLTADDFEDAVFG